jgi:hypothetical protein
MISTDEQANVVKIYKERLQNYKKQITQDMSFTDQLEMRDPQAVTEYTASIYANMRQEEI